MILIVGGRSPTTVYADTVEHTHIWADKYDSNNHWKYCTVCGAVKDKEVHTFTDHWAFGYESCRTSNYSKRICNCGYSYIYHKPHSTTRISSNTYYERVHATVCSSCEEWLKTEACKNENGVINCKNPGKCLTCGGTWPAGRHFINNGTCSTCGKTFYELSEPQISYSDDFTHVYIKYIFYPTDSSVIPIDTQTNYSVYTNGGMSHHGSITENSDGTYTINLDVTITYPNGKTSVDWMYNNVAVNGVTCFIHTSAITVWQDHQAPVQNDVIQKDQASANGWATIKQLTLSGTENLSDIVYLTVSDKATGEKYVTNAAVSVVDGKYSYTCTPSIEGDTNGRTYVVTAKDRIGNTSTKEFVVSKTDGSAPQLMNGTSLTYTDWSTSKNISLSFFDFGSGGVKASLDNQTDYKPLTKNGEYYIWNHSFGNQVGTSEHTIYVKDALGNATSYKLTVGNTDSNVYSISYNLNGGAMSGQKTSYTVADSFTLPTPTRTGYTFTGWTGSNGTTPQKTVTINKGTRGNLSYTANWSANQYSVTYDANGGTGTMDTDIATYNENYVTKANQFTRTGYEFIGWTENADGSGSNWTSWIGKPWKWTYTKNITLYAQWKAKTYTITYEPNGGVGDKYTQTATYDGFFDTTKNKFTKTGYSFIGYRDLISKGGTWAKTVIEGTKQTGSWVNSYVADKLRFYNYTDKIWITYDLLYWRGMFTKDNGCYANNFTLSAIWAANDYTVTLNYKKNVSSSYEKTIVTKYDSTYGELPQPMLPGWTFKGWNTKADGTGTTVTADTVYKIAGDSTLYAQWSYNPVSVKVPQILIGDHTGKSQFRVKCDNFKAGNIKISVPNSFLYKQTGKTDVTAIITAKNGNNTITSTNKVCIYNITTKNGLTAGCWQGSFNIGFTLTKE